MYAPIAIFCFDRPKHLDNLLYSLTQNKEFSESTIYFFQDGPKPNTNLTNWNLIKEVIDKHCQKKTFYHIISPFNKGCDQSEIDGITHVLNIHESIIVLEDDLIVSKTFLTYMNTGLNLFSQNSKVTSINAYSYNIRKKLPPYFFIKGGNPLGWGTWKRAWKHFINDGEYLYQNLLKNNHLKDYDFGGTIELLKSNKFWDVKWYASQYLIGGLGLFPNHSFSFHSGFDHTATHTHPEMATQLQYSVDNLNTANNFDYLNQIKIIEDKKAKLTLQHFYYKLNNKPFTLKEKISAKYYLFKHFVKTKIFRLA